MKMGLWGFIKSLFGFKEGKELPPTYDPPFIVMPGPQEAKSGDFWDQRRTQWNAKMEAERQRRSKYGGF